MNRIIEVIIGLGRNLAMAVASIVLIFLTLFVLGFSVIIMANIDKISGDIIESLSVYAYVDTNVDQAQEEEIIAQIEEIEGVGEIEVSSKEDQLQQVTQIWGKDGDMFREYFSGDKNPLNDVLIVQAEDEEVDLEQMALKIGTIKGIESADYGEGQGADKLIEALKKLQVNSNILTIVFAIITIFLIINTIKLTINSRRKAIEIMRLVGATKGYIMFPFAIEGMILGFLGGILAFVLAYFAYIEIYKSAGLFASVMVQPIDIRGELIIAQIVFGLIIGFLSAIIAIRSYLKI